jgi:nicotinate phosphoribosyltransferase
MSGDTVSLETDRLPGETLVVQVMRNGKRLASAETLTATRERAARGLTRLPEPLRKLDTSSYPVIIAEKLQELGRLALQR